MRLTRLRYHNRRRPMIDHEAGSAKFCQIIILWSSAAQICLFDHTNSAHPWRVSISQRFWHTLWFRFSVSFPQFSEFSDCLQACFNWVSLVTSLCSLCSADVSQSHVGPACYCHSSCIAHPQWYKWDDIAARIAKAPKISTGTVQRLGAITSPQPTTLYMKLSQCVKIVNSPEAI